MRALPLSSLHLPARPGGAALAQSAKLLPPSRLSTHPHSAPGCRRQAASGCWRRQAAQHVESGAFVAPQLVAVASLGDEPWARPSLRFQERSYGRPARYQRLRHRRQAVPKWPVSHSQSPRRRAVGGGGEWGGAQRASRCVGQARLSRQLDGMRAEMHGCLLDRHSGRAQKARSPRRGSHGCVSECARPEATASKCVAAHVAARLRACVPVPRVLEFK